MITAYDSKDRFVQQCIQQQTKTSGLRYKNQESMKDLLRWGENYDQDIDYKQKGHRRSELEKYQGKIKKQGMLTETTDSYRGFIYLPEHKLYVPVIPQDGFEFMEKPNFQDREPVKISEDAGDEEGLENKFQDVKNGTAYQNQFSLTNKKELYDVLMENYLQLQQQSFNKALCIKESIELENSMIQLQQQSQQKPQKASKQSSVNMKGTNPNSQKTTKNNSQQVSQQENIQKTIIDRKKLERELEQLQKEQQKLIEDIKILEGNINDNHTSKGQGFGSYDPVAQDPNDPERLKEREKRIKKFNQNTRDLPNSSFLSYYGKPAFASYGQANTKDKTSPFIANNYLKTHNINPHRGISSPEFIQSYNQALAHGKEEIIPHPPRNRLDEIPTKKQLEYQRKSNPLYPKQNKLLEEANRVPVTTIPSKRKVHPLLRSFESQARNSLGQGDSPNQAGRPSSGQVSYHQVSRQGEKQQNAQENEEERVNGNQVNNNSERQKQKLVQSQGQINDKQKQKQSQDQELGQGQQQPRSQKESKSSKDLSDQSPQFRKSKAPSSSKGLSSQQEGQNQEGNPQNNSVGMSSWVGSSLQKDGNNEKMELLKQRKEKQNLLVEKITETPEYNPLAYSLRNDYQIDDMNPPPGYFPGLHQCQLNPQYYRNKDKHWTRNIPYAGKKTNESHNLFEILQHPSELDPVY